MMTTEAIIAMLGLAPLPGEGGYYIETYQSAMQVPLSQLSGAYQGGHRQLSSAIYYLLTDEVDSFSALHRLIGDEIYHFYLGDPVGMLLLDPSGSCRRVVLGQNLEAGHRVQFVVPAGTWQGSRLLPGGKFALMGTTMAPGFDYRDFEGGTREVLSNKYPEWKEEIKRLTRLLG
jgi:uncharacterized protein